MGGMVIQSLQLCPVLTYPDWLFVALREDTDFQAQSERVCHNLDPVAFPLLFSVGPTELPPQSWIQKHNGFM